MQVPLFFPNADLSATPNIARYMQRCAERPAFEQVCKGIVLVTFRTLFLMVLRLSLRNSIR